MELSGPSSEIPTVYQKILDLEILSRVHFQPKILCFRGYIVKQEMELLKQEMELSGPCREIATVQQIILGFGILSKVHFQPKLLCFRNLPTKTGNGIIWTFQLDSHCPVDDFRLWNFVKSPFLAKVIVLQKFTN